MHHDQDEWIYIVDGAFDFLVSGQQSRVQTGDCIFIPRKAPHAWACVGERPGKIVNVYQPAGKMEEFFRTLSKYNNTAPIHEVLSLGELHRLFHDHGMDLVGPPLGFNGTS